MEERALLEEINAALHRIERLLQQMQQMTGRAALGEVRTDLPILPHGRRPRFWQDAEVRDFLTGLHRRVEIREALDACREAFGPERTPSRSALHRFWLHLDEIVRRAA
jgi:hypothetical protein